jgi:hypothetical protein
MKAAAALPRRTPGSIPYTKVKEAAAEPFIAAVCQRLRDRGIPFGENQAHTHFKQRQAKRPQPAVPAPERFENSRGRARLRSTPNTLTFVTTGTSESRLPEPLIPGELPSDDAEAERRITRIAHPRCTATARRPILKLRDTLANG